MTDYGRELSFGVFLTPNATTATDVVGLAELAEDLGLDLVTFSDHPYQPKFLDAWTLLSYVAARTHRVQLSGNVINLPLRQPAVLARSAASLDLLSGGRVELGLGAGAFSDAIEAMGGARRTPGEAVDALTEAIEVIRELWAGDRRGGVFVDGDHYQVRGAKRGPSPAHPIGIWLGAYRPRMLRLVGTRADGWLPSEAYLDSTDIAADLRRGHERIDEAARTAGRQPREIRRLLNLNPDSDTDRWTERLTGYALEGIDTFILGTDDPHELRRFALEIGPAVRGLVAAERSGQPRSDEAGTRSNEVAGTGSVPAGGQPGSAGPAGATAEQAQWQRLGLTPTAPPEPALSGGGFSDFLGLRWDESTRPRRRPSGEEVGYSDHGRAVGKHLIDVHDHLRSELGSLRSVLEQVRSGSLQPGAARSLINQLTIRQNDWTLGAYCASYCRVVTGHHSLEDESIFPHLRATEDDLAPVLDRLESEHDVIADVLALLDRKLVAFIAAPDDFTALEEAIDLLSDVLLSHLSYEESQLIEPLARLGFYPDQV